MQKITKKEAFFQSCLGKNNYAKGEQPFIWVKYMVFTFNNNSRKTLIPVISAMPMFGIVNGWSAEKVVAELERLGISRENIDRVLNQGCEE